MQRDRATTFTHLEDAPRRVGPSVQSLFALTLALLTGLILGQLPSLGSGLIDAGPSAPARNEQTGIDFYDAVDAYLQTGQTTQLRALIHPDVIDHVDGQPATSGMDALLRGLDTLHTPTTSNRLDATVVSSNGDLVQFAIAIVPGGNDSGRGLPFSPAATPAAMEMLRISDGRIVERWSTVRPSTAVSSIASIVWDPPPARQLVPAIEQITMLAGSTMMLALGTAHVIAVQDGVLTVERMGRDTASSNPASHSDAVQVLGSEPMRALPGQAVFAAGNGPFLLSNDGPQVASALLIRIAGHALPTSHPELGPFGASQNDPGVQIDALAAATAYPSPSGAWSIEIGQVTLAAGASIPRHAIVGAELLWIEEGALDADVQRCASRCTQTVDGVATHVSGPSQLWAGQGFCAFDGASTAYRAGDTGPATVTYLTIIPAAS